MFEVFYGGARGGGKTDGSIGDWLIHADRYGQNAAGLFLRRRSTQLQRSIARAIQLARPLGHTWKESKNTLVSPTGGTLKFTYLERDKDAEEYQGHDYTRIYMEELTNYPNPEPVMKMMATLRSGAGVPCRFRATGNPGGPGHNWVKARYIDVAPPMRVFTDPETGLKRVFIPAKLDDNPVLSSNPQYAAQLKQSGNAQLVRAWLEGDWDIVAGGMFDDLWDRTRHVIEPFSIPWNWRIDRSLDWGSAKPFSVGWWAESNGEALPDGRWWPRGTLFRIGEWYGSAPGKPNTGLRLTATEVAQGVKAREEEMGIAKRALPGPADSAIFSSDNSRSVADDMADQGVYWEAGAKGAGSRRQGAQQLRGYLRNALAQPMESPGLLIFNTCTHWIRTVPVLPRDSRDPEDVDTHAEDHAYDETRYRLSAPGTIDSLIEDYVF